VFLGFQRPFEVGNQSALLQDGDQITIDAEAGVLEVNLTQEEFNRRALSWKPRDNGYGAGALFKYAQQVGPAVDGAVTHPGAAAEVVCYADV
jgi:dihydroxy-acid dehydratase